MKGIIGKKLGMTQLFDDNGNRIAVTVVEAGPCTVTQVRTTESDGYSAVQLAFEDCKDKQLTKAELGHLKKAGLKHGKRHLAEIRGMADLKVGDTVTVEAFEDGQHVSVTGVSKGKGFQGTVKRHKLRARARDARLAQRSPAGLDRRERLPEPGLQGQAHVGAHGRPAGHPARPAGRRPRP